MPKGVEHQYTEKAPTAAMYVKESEMPLGVEHDDTEPGTFITGREGI